MQAAPLNGRNEPIRILIADDQQDILDALRLLLLDEGYEVDAGALARPRRSSGSRRPTSTSRSSI